MAYRHHCDCCARTGSAHATRTALSFTQRGRSTQRRHDTSDGHDQEGIYRQSHYLHGHQKTHKLESQSKALLRLPLASQTLNTRPWPSFIVGSPYRSSHLFKKQ